MSVIARISESSRLIVGVCGIPASGKSSLAKLIIKNCNDILGRQEDSRLSTVIAIVVGLDGWHLTRAQLDAFPDPKLAHDRRGARWTFDGDGYAVFVDRLREPLVNGMPNVVNAPAFDHAVKDPEPDAVSVLSQHRIVIIEGLYTFLSVEPWKSAGEKLDERWLVDISIGEATKRLVKRHVLTGVAKDLKEAIWRAENNDMPNGQFVIDNILEPTRRIPSLDDPVFVEVVA